MRFVTALLCVLALPVCGCSKSKSNPVAPAPPSENRGTPLGADNVFLTSNLLLWSAATNEIVGAGSYSTPSLEGLIAMHGATGDTRVLDSEGGLLPLASSSGTPVYYGATVFDPTFGQRRAVGQEHVPRRRCASRAVASKRVRSRERARAARHRKPTRRWKRSSSTARRSVRST